MTDENLIESARQLKTHCKNLIVTNCGDAKNRCPFYRIERNGDGTGRIFCAITEGLFPWQWDIDGDKHDD